MNKSVLFVDDEVHALKALTRLFRKEPYEFITCDSPVKALNQLDEIEPMVVISDQCMPEMDGIEFLEKVKNKQPGTVRILLTGISDLEVAIAAINQGNVYRYIEKPWDDQALKKEVRAAMDHQDSIYCLRHMVDGLVEEVMHKNKEGVHELGGAISVELKQPLHIISGYVQLLQLHLADNEILKKYLSNILLQIDKIEDLADKIDHTAKV